MLQEQNILYQKLHSYLNIINFNCKIAAELELHIKNLNLYPIDEQILIALPLEQRSFIDAIVYRFLIIQDHTSNKLFPLIAQIITNQTQQFSWFDILALMAKHNIITSEQDWGKLRKLRNLFSHEYDETPNIRATYINRLISALPILNNQIQLINNYAQHIFNP